MPDVTYGPLPGSNYPKPGEAENLAASILTIPTVDELALALLDMVIQWSNEDQGGMLYSSCLSANADAMRLLARYGYLEIVRDMPGTRNVWAFPTAKTEALRSAGRNDG